MIHPDQINLGELKITSQWSCPAPVAVGDPVYVAAGVAYMADCTDLAKMPAIGIVVSKPTPTSCVVVHSGRVRIVGWGLVQGEPYYVGPGAGVVLEPALPTVDGTVVQKIAVAEDSDTLMVTATQEFSIIGQETTDIECDIGMGGVALRDLVYVSGDNTVDKASAAAEATMPAMGFVVALPGGGKCLVRKSGVLGGFVGIVPGTTYWASPSVAGGIIAPAPNGTARIIQEVCSGLKSDTILIEIDRDYTVNPV